MSQPRPNPEWSMPMVIAFGAATVASVFAATFTLAEYLHNRLRARRR